MDVGSYETSGFDVTGKACSGDPISLKKSLLPRKPFFFFL